MKQYSVIFTCLALHLEVTSSLDTDSFVNALRCFITRCGQVVELRADNRNNLVGAERELREAIERWNHTQINNTLTQNGINWIFNPPSGSLTGKDLCIKFALRPGPTIWTDPSDTSSVSSLRGRGAMRYRLNSSPFGNMNCVIRDT